jgi:hypothetical protein
VLVSNTGGHTAVRQALRIATRLGVVAGLVAAFALFVPAERTRLPLAVLTGQESAEAYIRREVHLAPLLAETSALLPPDTLVGYTGTAGPGYYTEARLAYLLFPELESLGSRPGEIRESLEQRGIRYFIWDRGATPVEAWGAPLLSTQFLYRNTRILAGDSGGYLFELLPAGKLDWGVEQPRLVLQNPGLGLVGQPSGPWTTTGNVVMRQDVAWLGPNSSLAQRVEVNGGHDYVLTTAGQCPGNGYRAYLALRWLDADGKELGIDRESVVLGMEPSAQFLWRRAPEAAAAAVAEVSMPPRGTCQFERVSLHELD